MKATIRQSGKADRVQDLTFSDAEVVSSQYGVLVIFEVGHQYFDGERTDHPCELCEQSCCVSNKICHDCYETEYEATHMTPDEEEQLDEKLFGPGSQMDRYAQYGPRGC